MHHKVRVIHLLRPYYINQGIRGIKLLYLPPYSPDYNPNEEFFSAYKAFLCRYAVEFQLAVEGGDDAVPFTFLYNALEEVGKANPRGWFAHAHYV